MVPGIQQPADARLWNFQRLRHCAPGPGDGPLDSRGREREVADELPVRACPPVGGLARREGEKFFQEMQVEIQEEHPVKEQMCCAAPLSVSRDLPSADGHVGASFNSHGGARQQ